MRDIKPEERVAIVAACSKWSDPATGKLVYGGLKSVMKQFPHVSSASIKRFYALLKANPNAPDLSRKRLKRCGMSSLFTEAVRAEYIRIAQEYANMWIRLTQTLLRKELSDAGFHFSAGTIHNHLKLLKAKRVNLKIKPALTEAHKEARMDFVLSQAQRRHGVQRHIHHYKDQMDTVHVDESWFFLQTDDNSVLIFDGVVLPNAPVVRHKSHIQKVMFLVAMARPRMLPDGTWFDGKIGLWECTEESPAARNSRHRPAGTLITKPKSMDGAFYKLLFTKAGGVLQSIKLKMPWLRGDLVKIQHDGARPHTGLDNPAEIARLGSTEGWRFKVVTQPAQSPDLNILNLGLFHSLKSRVAAIKQNAVNIDQLIAKVKLAYQAYDGKTLDHIWAHSYACWNSILQDNGGNQYKKPHVGARIRPLENGSCVNLEINVDEYNRVFWLRH